MKINNVLETLLEGMPSGVVRMKSEWSQMTPEEKWAKIQKVAADKRRTPMEMAKRWDRLFANKNREIQRFVARMQDDRANRNDDRQLEYVDRGDIEIHRDVQQRKRDAEDRVRGRDEFRGKMKGQGGLSVGDRVRTPKGKLLKVVRIDADGVHFKGADKPYKIKTKFSGEKSDLGHRIFDVVK